MLVMDKESRAEREAIAFFARCERDGDSRRIIVFVIRCFILSSHWIGRPNCREGSGPHWVLT